MYLYSCSALHGADEIENAAIDISCKYGAAVAVSLQLLVKVFEAGFMVY